MLKDLIQNKKLILVCGSGGVGKTTVAAALALQAALVGKKVVVLTIDPAKRLASSLGLSSLSSEPKKISTSYLEDLKPDHKAEFYAMMLDTKSTFDQLVIKYSPNKNIEQKILNNKIYKHLSDMIAGSQEYMAMEKLFEIMSENKYDLVVIDTPPTIHAIDFLEAPQRMIDAISHSMMHILLKPAMMVGKSGFKLFQKGSQMILKVFDRITGFAFLQDISEMLLSFQSLLDGFKNRADEVKKILQDSNTAFVLVTACEEKSVKEAQFFGDKLQQLDLPLSGIILNRVHPFYEISKDQRQEDEEKLRQLMGDSMSEKIMDVFDQYQKTALRDNAFEKELKKNLGPTQDICLIPLFESDIHDLQGLHRLGQYLI